MIFNYVVDDDVQTWEQAWGKVNMIEVGVNSLVPFLQKYKNAKALFEIGANLLLCIEDNKPQNINDVVNCGIYSLADYVLGSISEVAIDKAVLKLKKYWKDYSYKKPNIGEQQDANAPPQHTKLNKQIFFEDIKVGTQIVEGISVKRFFIGTNKKIAIIGTDMKNRIEPTAKKLQERGCDIELFNIQFQKQTFIIDGKEYYFKDLTKNFDDIKQEYYKNSPWIPYNEESKIIIQSTLMYRANKLFIEKLIKEGYSIIDIGASYNSHFYDMETSLLKNILWVK